MRGHQHAAAVVERALLARADAAVGREALPGEVPALVVGQGDAVAGGKDLAFCLLREPII